jgi:hypothetical protein
MKSNLLFVQRFCRDNVCSFYFDANCFQIQDLLIRKPLYKGFSKDRLYPITGLTLPSSNSCVSNYLFRSSHALPSSPSASHVSYTTNLSTARSNISHTYLLHMHLSHPQTRVLHHVLSHHFVSHKFPVSNTFCKHFVMGKTTQLPFSTSISCTKSPLEIVHSDVWGPVPINSINAHRYYVIFMDDFTRFTWFFPLKHKSQVFTSFKHFKKNHGKSSWQLH